MSTESLYFIALIPDKDIATEVDHFKHYAADHFNTKHALRSPPHITLLPPFRWPAAQLAQVDLQLKAIAQKHPSFLLGLSGFDCFAPRVIFVDIVANRLLDNLQAHMQKQLYQKLQLQADRPPRPFHPHMTVAFKDLKKAIFPQAWAHFSGIDYQRYFQVKGFYLLHHREKRWHVHSHFALTGS
ncbi:MAG: 2'-5' RNA ligase family protein [Bacteroidota bacterium]